VFTKNTTWLLSLVTNVLIYHPKKVIMSLLIPNPNILVSKYVPDGVSSVPAV
jgi:hypothetical protein